MPALADGGVALEVGFAVEVSLAGPTKIPHALEKDVSGGPDW